MLKVPLIATTPGVVPVIVKVWGGEVPVQVSVVGANVTPATGLGVKVPVVTPLGPTVKLPLGVLIRPEAGLGPVSTNEVAPALAVVIAIVFEVADAKTASETTTRRSYCIPGVRPVAVRLAVAPATAEPLLTQVFARWGEACN